MSERNDGYGNQHFKAGERGGATGAFKGDQGVTGRRAMNDEGASEVEDNERAAPGTSDNGATSN